MKNIASVTSLIAATIWSIYSITHIFIIKLPSVIPSTILLIGFIAGLHKIIKPNNFSVNPKKSKLLFILIILSISISTTLQIFFSRQVTDEVGRTTSGFLLTTTIISMAWLLIGSGIERCQLKESTKISIFIMAFLSLCIFINAEDNYLINWSKMQSENDGANELNHLIVGFQASHLLLFAYSLSPKLLKIPITIGSLFVLFSLGGRTSLLCYMATIIIHNAVQQSIKKTFISIIVVATLATIIIYNLEINFNDQYISRMLFQGGIDQDESKIARDQFFLEGIENLPYQTLFGNVNIFVEKYNTFGSYSHNILSAWQIYGIIPFSLIIFATIYIGKKLSNTRISDYDKISEFGLLLYIFSTLSIITGKFIGFPMYWLAIGFWLTRLAENPEFKKSNYQGFRK